MSSRQKLVFVISGLRELAIQYEWIARSRIGRDFDFSCVFLTPEPTPFEAGMRAIGVPTRWIRLKDKSDYPRATAQLFAYFRQLKPTIVHTHLADANRVGLLAAKLAGVPRRIYTRHHSTVNHENHPQAVLQDRMINAISTDIIATCKVGTEILTEWEFVPAKKVHEVHFGIEFSYYHDVTPEHAHAMRAKWDLEGRGPIIGVIAEYVEYKGMQDVIPAFKRLLAKYPDACLVLAGGERTPFQPVIAQMLSEIPSRNQRELVFETDAPGLYSIFDVFVHVPRDALSEAFGQTYIEAMAAEVPSVFTSSGIAREIVRDEENALVVPYRSPDAVYTAALRLLTEPELARRLTKQAYIDVQRAFPLTAMIEKLMEIYERDPS